MGLEGQDGTLEADVHPFPHWLRLSPAAIAAAVLVAGCSAPAATPTSPPAAAPTTPAASATTAPVATSSSGGAAAGSGTSTTSATAGPAPTGSPIKIGVLDDITGTGAIEGALLRIGVDMVVDEINTTGGINGHPVQAQFVDPRADATQSIQLATQLVQQDNVDLLVGGGFSPECIGVQDLAPKLGVVFVPADACASDTFSTQTCNRYTFRPYSVAYQFTDPVTTWEVQNIGKSWGILYPDYALGQSNLKTNQAALSKAGGELSVQIAVPLGEANVTPYVTKIPTDGSIQGLIVSETGTDLARVVNVMQQFGITQKMPIVTAIGKESFGGEYPDALNGSIITGTRPSEGLPGNQSDADFMARWKAMAHKDADVTGPLGGADKATPGVGNGYNVIISMEGLKNAMRQANFTGRADTDKLITAMENLNLPQGPDLPDGPLVMGKLDHQGKTNVYLMKINGQHEDIIQTFTPDQLSSGSCQVASS